MVKISWCSEILHKPRSFRWQTRDCKWFGGWGQIHPCGLLNCWTIEGEKKFQNRTGHFKRPMISAKEMMSTYLWSAKLCSKLVSRTLSQRVSYQRGWFCNWLRTVTRFIRRLTAAGWLTPLLGTRSFQRRYALQTTSRCAKKGDLTVDVFTILHFRENA